MSWQRQPWVSYLFIGLAAGAIFALAALASVGGYYLLAGTSDSVPPTPLPSAPPALPFGAIAGRVWHDQCAQTDPRAGEPPVTSSGCVTLPEGGFGADGVFDPSEPPVAGVKVLLGVGSCPATTWRESQALGDGTFVFTDLPAGSYCVMVDADAQDYVTLQPGRWTLPRSAAPSALALLPIELGPGETRDGADFGWDYLYFPVLDPTPTPAPSPVPTPAGCTDQATFVTDVTIPDGTWILPGVSFDKVWRLRNTGTCTWTSSYSLAFVSGQSLGGSSPVALPALVAPGQTVDLGLRLTAPLPSGTYRGNWMLRNPTGGFFGIGPEATSAFWVIINVGDTSSGAGPWRGEYFDNRSLSGSPGLVRQDPVIDFDWGASPGSGISSDDFSVRWTGELTLKGGTYDFRVVMDDGARLWIDGEKVLDDWRDGAKRERVVSVPLVEGKHSLRLEYYEHSGAARILLGWSPVTRFPDWKGEYFANRELNGAPALIRNDEKVDFDWGRGTPANGLPNDGFSARWTAKLSFDPARYRVNAQADDGVRVWIGGQRVIDEWHDSSGTQVYSVEMNLSGKVDVVVEYFERSGNARVRFWVEAIPRTPTPSPSPTTSATPSPTPTASHTATASATPSPSISPTPSPTSSPTDTPTPTETPTDTPTPTATCVPIECGPVIPPG